MYSSCNMLGQMLHLTSFSPGCIFICTFSVFAWETKYSHLLHFCDFSCDSSQHVLERRHNHTRCICETSLHDHVYFEFETEIWTKKMLESRPEDALVKLVKLVNIVKLVKQWRLYWLYWRYWRYWRFWRYCRYWRYWRYWSEESWNISHFYSVRYLDCENVETVET